MPIHFTHGSSTAKRQLACPAWSNLAKAAPAINRESDAARRGTLLHSRMESFYRDDVPLVALQEGLSEEDADALAVAVDATENVLDAFAIDELLVEKTLIHPDRTDCGGTGDLVGFGDEWVMVLDYKFGHRAVTDWSQHMFLYWQLALDERYEGRLEGKRHAAVIIQPAVSRKPIMVELDADEMYRWQHDYHDALRATDAGAIQGNPGEHCHFCVAAPYCPAQRARARTFIQLDPKVSEDLSEGMSLVAQMKQQITAIEAQTYAVLEAGMPVSGWKLVLKQGRNHWIDEEAAWGVLSKQRKLLKDDYTTTALRTAPQVLAAIKRAGVTLNVEHLVTNASTGTTLAPESDKRPAVVKDSFPEALNAIMNG